MAHVYEAQSTNHGDHGCMVDSLSCIGLLKAKELVRAMLQREATVIWESISATCENQGKTA